MKYQRRNNGKKQKKTGYQNRKGVQGLKKEFGKKEKTRARVKETQTK